MKEDIAKRNKKIYELFKNGVKRADIARQYHISRARVSGIIHEMEYKLNCPEIRRVLSNGTYLVVKRFGINSLDELKEWAKNNELCDIPSVGEKRKAEIIRAIS